MTVLQDRLAIQPRQRLHKPLHLAVSRRLPSRHRHALPPIRHKRRARAVEPGRDAAQRSAAAERERKTVRVNEFITVSELAQQLAIPATQIVGFAFKTLGLMVTINQRLDFDQIELIAGEFGFLAGSIGVAAAPLHAEAYPALVAAAERALHRLARAGGDGAESALDPAAEPSHPPLEVERFVGRADQVRTLVRMLDDASLGRGQVAVVHGEIGVGVSPGHARRGGRLEGVGALEIVHGLIIADRTGSPIVARPDAGA